MRRGGQNFTKVYIEKNQNIKKKHLPRKSGTLMKTTSDSIDSNLSKSLPIGLTVRLGPIGGLILHRKIV